MIEITKCDGANCPLKEKCFRYTAKNAYWYYYFTNAPYDKEKNNCDYYLDNEKE